MSWRQLLDIAHEAAQLAADERARPRQACPRCGEPLEAGPRGELHCRFDGYTTDGNAPG